MKILILVPDLNKIGGVANSHRVIKNYFTSNVSYFIRGSRANRNYFYNTFFRPFIDYYNFYITLKKEKFDLVQINTSLGAKGVFRDTVFIFITQRFHLDYIVFFHGWKIPFEKFIDNYFLFFFKRTFLKSKAIIVLCSDFKKKLEEWKYKKSIFQENTIIEKAIFTSNYEAIQKSREESSTFNILFLSRIEKAKGIYEALDTFSILRKKIEKFRFKIAGDGRELSKAKLYVAEKNIPDVEFLGYVTGEQKRNLFYNSHLYILPTYSEGMPTSTLEAMAAGLPVITSFVGGVKDFFENDKMGYITADISPKILANLTLKLISDPEKLKQISKYNNEYALKYFSPEIVANRLEAIYLYAKKLNTFRSCEI